MVELGNFKIKSVVQNKKEIKWDTFTDISSLINFRRSNTKIVLETFNFPGQNPWTIYNFNWSPKYITDRFKLVQKYASQVDYLIFLLQEEIYLPSQSTGFQKVPNDYKNYPSYQIPEASNMWIHTNKGEVHFYCDLLRAWHKMCYNLGKKTAICGCPVETSDPKITFERVYSPDALKIIAKEYDMVYLYKYPISKSKSSCTSNGCKTRGYCAKEVIDYWRKTLYFKGKINYILDTYFGSNNGSLEYNTIMEDFYCATNSGAHIISAYPFINYKNNDTKGASRLIQIKNAYQGSKRNGW